jgi:hypothetical protein
MSAGGGTTAAPGLFQHRIDRFPHALKNSTFKPPRSGILALVQAAMNSGRRLK